MLPPVSGGVTPDDRAAIDDCGPAAASCRSWTTPCPTCAASPRVAPTSPGPSWPGATGGDAAGDVADGLRDVLADRLLGAADRPPRPAEDFSDHPRAAELDELCAGHGFGRLDELDRRRAGRAGRRRSTRSRRASSAERRSVYAELDDAHRELVRALPRRGVGRRPARTDAMTTPTPTTSARSSRTASPSSASSSAQREVASMSVRRLAELAGVSNPYLSQIERGCAGRRPRSCSSWPRR